jgi:GTP-binding protein HflX
MPIKPVNNPSREPETAFLVGIERPAGGDNPLPGADSNGDGAFAVEDSLAELKELSRTAGLAVAGETYQRLKEIHAGTLIGPGKVAEIRERAQALEADVVLFDDELSPGQQKNLEKAFGEDLQVLDRTALILDIFAMHAHTNEGKLQVELAQYVYRLPRLTRMWTHLARQAGGRRGGVGLRGPGETQLEIDRRAIRKKIATLEKDLEDVRRQREKLRERRRSEGLFTAALAGYTNAGKSTLLNVLSGAGLHVEDKLFSTLDPTTRRVRLPAGLTVLVTDTVGFISKLPHDLVAAFRATFEEIGEADLVLHLVDASHPNALLHREVVERELAATLGAQAPVLTVWNKIDLLTPDTRRRLLSENGRLGVSARTGTGLPELLREIERRFTELLTPVILRIPYAEGRHLALVHECGSGVAETHEGDATLVRALVPPAVKEKLGRFLVDPER